MTGVQGLWPSPRKAVSKPGFFPIPEGMVIRTEASEVLTTAIDKLLHQWNTSCQGELSLSTEIAPANQPHIALIQDPANSEFEEHYKLQIDPQGIVISAASTSGLFYGLTSLCQWVRVHFLKEDRPLTQLPCLDVDDQPDFKHRGWMIDISRSKVPTMATLFSWVDLAAEFKINQLQLYTEHTFAYEGHKTVWAEASPMTPQNILSLDTYCRNRCITLVPNQNSFGHFHQWLKHEPYRHLAECPEGVQHPFSLDLEPFSLCPIDPKSLALLEDLFAQYLPLFSSTYANVGLDETFDLGQGRSAKACKEIGRTAVYLDFLNNVHQRLQTHGKQMQFWGDIIIEHPEYLHRLPKDGIALEWGYEADHPFEENAAKYAASGCEFYVCPGTSSWSSVLGRVDNAMANLASAAAAGKKHGATGYLITDWGDYGHFQPPAVSWPAWVAGAGFAWRSTDAEGDYLALVKPAIHQHLLQTADDHLIQALWHMGLAYRDCGMQPTNGSSLFYLLLYANQPMSHERLKDLTEEGLSRSRERLQLAQDILQNAPMTGAESDTVFSELCWACDLISFACDLGSARLLTGREKPISSIPLKTKHLFDQRLENLIARFVPLRDRHFRPGGTKISLRYLKRIQRLLRQDPIKANDSE